MHREGRGPPFRVHYEQICKEKKKYYDAMQSIDIKNKNKKFAR